MPNTITLNSLEDIDFAVSRGFISETQATMQRAKLAKLAHGATAAPKQAAKATAKVTNLDAGLPTDAKAVKLRTAGYADIPVTATVGFRAVCTEKMTRGTRIAPITSSGGAWKSERTLTVAHLDAIADSKVRARIAAAIDAMDAAWRRGTHAPEGIEAPATPQSMDADLTF